MEYNERSQQTAALPEEERSERRKQYVRPQILHELELETRAGSPITGTNPLDPLGVGLGD